MSVVAEIIAERRRQIEVEGWTSDHDDNEHEQGELARAASCYAYPHYEGLTRCPDAWPWDIDWWKPKDRRRNLIRAAALILAEIERIDRSKTP